MISDIPVAQQEVTTKKGSPWSGIGRKLTDGEWTELKEWRQRNADTRWRHGDRGPSGLVFVAYQRRYKAGERWLNLERFKRERELVKLCAKRERNKIGAKEIAKKKRLKKMTDPLFREAARKYIREKMRKRYADPRYRERMKENRRKEAARNLDRQRMSNIKRIVKKLGAIHPECDDKTVLLLSRQAKAMSGAQKRSFAVDHVVPMARGGFHHHKNLQILPRDINISKHAKVFWLSDDYMDFRDVPEFLWPENLKPYYQLMLRIFGHPLKKLAETA